MELAGGLNAVGVELAAAPKPVGVELGTPMAEAVVAEAVVA